MRPDSRASVWVARMAIVAAAFACAEPTGNGTTEHPSIVVAVTSAAFSATAGGANPGNTPIAVTNGGTGTLSGLDATVDYGTSPPGWLAATLGAATAPTTLTLAATTGALSSGTYTATVSVASASAGNSPRLITVTFTVFANAIFVSESDPSAANDATCGLGPANTGAGRYPCLTIAQGLIRAAAIGRPEVIVADGRYDEAVTLVNGISLLGGYSPDTWDRHLATTNTIVRGVSSAGNHDRTIIASGITSPTVLEGFVIRGSLNSKTGGNSYAIFVTNSDADLVIRNNVIEAGRGGPGSAGSAGASGAAGANGGDRASDPTAYDATIATGTGFCNSSNDRALVNGGLSTYGGDVVDGGNGGGNTCPPSTNQTQLSAADGADGQPATLPGGANGAGGAGGADGRLDTGGSLCYVPTFPLVMEGANGTNGGGGAHANAVAGGAGGSGSVVSGHWRGDLANNGLNGANGGGGGGGGAGGGGYCFSCAENKDRLGGHGGGGGAGGAGGEGGGAGGAGGGAFGVFVLNGAAPVITGNEIVRGEGGSGSVGGNAAVGGLGGFGGLGGQGSLFCTGPGGRGGDGGAGGHGSGGGGGSGGASFGIYTFGVGTPTYCDPAENNVIGGGAVGAGGQGGLSLINPGGAGQPGALLACSFN